MVAASQPQRILRMIAQLGVIVRCQKMPDRPPFNCAGTKSEAGTLENSAMRPCSFFFSLDVGRTSAKVADVAQGKPIILIMGDQPTVVATVRIISGSDEQNLIPNVRLPIGKRYAVVVGEDGKARGSVSDR